MLLLQIKRKIMPCKNYKKMTIQSLRGQKPLLGKRGRLMSHP
jgi:hypothetical protein